MRLPAAPESANFLIVLGLCGFEVFHVSGDGLPISLSQGLKPGFPTPGCWLDPAANLPQHAFNLGIVTRGEGEMLHVEELLLLQLKQGISSTCMLPVSFMKSRRKEVKVRLGDSMSV